MSYAVFRNLKVITEPKGKVALAQLKTQTTFDDELGHYPYLRSGLSTHTGNAALALGLHSTRWQNNTQIKYLFEMSAPSKDLAG